MPGSRIQGKEEIKEWFSKQKGIRTIVDVGAGSGTYPKLLGPTYIYKAIEIFEPYIKMWGLKDYYSEIIIGDVCDVKWPTGDCIIFGDVLEHIQKDKAKKVLQKALDTFTYVIVSIPVSKYENEIQYGMVHYDNQYESHISGWTFLEMKNFYPWSIATLFAKEVATFIK